MPRYRFLLASVCALLAWSASTLMSGADFSGASKYAVKKWENDEGLPQNSVLSMAQTRDGYLWVGTFSGLVRFDGINFKNLTPELNDRVVHLFEDSRRTLWIGTENSGTLMLKDGRLIAPPELAAGGFDRRLRAACEDSDGAVWLYYENGDVWRCVPGRPPRGFAAPPDSGTRTMIRETNGPVWLGTLRHQYSIGPVAENGLLELPVGQDISFSRLDALVSSARGGYWRLANAQVQRVIGGSARNVAGYAWPLQISSACEDHHGNLVVGTKGAGVFLVSTNGEVSSISTNDQLSANTILSVLVDQEGTLWVGTDGGGLNRVKRNTFQTIEASRNWTVQSIAEGAPGTLWIGGNYRFGLGYWTNNTMLRLGPLQNFFPFEPSRVQCVFVDRAQQLWMSSGTNLFQFHSGGLEVVNTRGLHQGPVQSIFQDRAGQMWFGSSGALLRFANGDWKLFSSADGLDASNVTAIAEDRSGTIWVGTQRSGLYRLREGQFTALGKSGSAPSDVSALLFDDENVLWTTTSVGLGRYENGRWTYCTTNAGMVSDKLGYLLDDSEGNLWIGSNLGVLRVSKQALRQFARGAVNSVACRAYGKADGLPTRECTSGSQPGAWRGASNTLWFPTSKGVAMLKLSQFRPNANPPPVMIESVLVDDVFRQQTVDSAGATNLVLRPGDERLEIQYTSLNLGAPDRARFRYRLEGYEKEWTDAGNVRFAKYTRLDPGHYTFHLVAANEDGVWNVAGTSLAISVIPPPPPLWQRWWFISLVAACIIGLTVAVVHYLSTQKLQRQVALLRQQEALEKERARIARDIHDQVGASLTQVALLGELVETDKDSPEEISEHAQQISQTARETTRVLDEIVWTVNPQNDTLEGLVNYICKYAQDYLAVAGLRYRFDLPAELPAHVIAPDVRHNVFLASKEAVTNVVRHAKATAAWVRLKLERDAFTLEIEDNGRGVAGLDLNAPRTRNGLKNMRKRMEDVGGSFSIVPGGEGGALVCLKVPLGSTPPKTT